MVVVLPLPRSVEGEAPRRARFDGLFGVEPRVRLVRRVIVLGGPVGLLTHVLEHDGVSRPDLDRSWLEAFVRYVHDGATVFAFVG